MGWRGIAVPCPCRTFCATVISIIEHLDGLVKVVEGARPNFFFGARALFLRMPLATRPEIAYNEGGGEGGK